MRLTHLKLAGFKSFVDPTTLHIHGQRVGVVGPNGCGKSNVMESVRWVLGESSAKEMRGDSMDAVIFNGSGNRKPISRASVELIFDNSLGGANGEWSQYAEIAVKRVIERDKGSSYYINNTSVRRRDVADLFLGTGLGGRAYAIIGQNTISRIVEAKPEELRVFLEEAAGISKYKERRRETELRLRDTRENLTRIEDIRREMDKQITRLESQALVTEQYHRLQDALKLAQGQLWLLKKRDASISWEKNQRQVDKLANELEAQMAALRKTESLLETLRQQNYASTEAVQQAQARYYETNADVSNLENQVRNTQEARERLGNQLQQLVQQLHKLEQQQLQLQEKLQALGTEQQQAAQQEQDTAQALTQAKAALPEAERAHSASQRAYGDAQRALSEAEQGIRLESASLEHLSRSVSEARQRLQRLETEQASLQLPDHALLDSKQAELLNAQTHTTQLEATIASLRQQEHQHAEHIRQLREAQLAEERRLAQLTAQAASLEKLQQSIGHESKLAGWLEAHGLQHHARLWQKISIQDGWETALEAVLGARLNAIVQPAGVFPTYRQRPPVPLVISQGDADASLPPATAASRKRLLDSVVLQQPELAPVLHDWLDGVYLLDEQEDAELARLALQPGQLLVNRLGDVYSRHSVSLYAAQSALHGVLERERELGDLHSQLPQAKQALQTHRDALATAEQQLQQARATLHESQAALRSSTQLQHTLSLEIQKLQQQRQHALDRQQSLQTEQAGAQQRISTIVAEQEQKTALLQQLRGSLAQLLQDRERTHGQRQHTDIALNSMRSQLQQAERVAQEKSFNIKLITNNINELNSRIHATLEEDKALRLRQSETEAMLNAARMDGLQANLQAALELKQQREAELAAARDAMAGAEQELQTHERNRMQNEQMLHPLRDKLEQARLQEQQARLYFEQCQEALLALFKTQPALDEARLADNLSLSAKAGDFERSAQSLQAQIEELGPVNLAAIQELASERERKSYLDSQALDLEQAIATLEDAIHRIDKETRSRLQQTFDDANRHFGELFTTLFGGGQARLELLGEEILDTGMQVFAQPPGKKNSTIHLLSGGEKALTALALVFALFRLNPAPFCLMDEVDAPLDDSNTERFCSLVKKMSERTQFLFVSHNKITMEMAQQLIGVTMQESGVSRIVEVDIEAAMQMQEAVA